MSALATIALLSMIGVEPFVYAWDKVLPAPPPLAVSFAKVDAHELKPFVEPLSVHFPKVDANELKPFVEPITASFPKVDADELKAFPVDSELE